MEVNGQEGSQGSKNQLKDSYRLFETKDGKDRGTLKLSLIYSKPEKNNRIEERHRLNSSTISKILRSNKLAASEEFILVREAAEIDPSDFSHLSSVQGQLLALEKMNFDVVNWRRKLISRESLRTNPEVMALKAYLLRYAKSTEVIDRILDTQFNPRVDSNDEYLLFGGDPAYGSIMRFYQLRPIKHGMDSLTIQSHAEYQYKILRKLFALDVKHIFFQEGWCYEKSRGHQFFQSSPTQTQAFYSEAKWLMSGFVSDIPENMMQLFPDLLQIQRLTLVQKLLLAFVGAEKIYAMLRPDVIFHTCMSADDCNELSNIVGDGSEKGSAFIASRYMVLKTVTNLKKFFDRHNGELVALSMNPAHEIGPIETERFSPRPIHFIVEWPELFNQVEWQSPNSIRKALANVVDPIKQERIVNRNLAVPLASYQHLSSRNARKEALAKLVGDLADLRLSDTETIEEYLLYCTPEREQKLVIQYMAERSLGIFNSTRETLKRLDHNEDLKGPGGNYNCGYNNP